MIKDTTTRIYSVQLHCKTVIAFPFFSLLSPLSLLTLISNDLCFSIWKEQERGAHKTKTKTNSPLYVKPLESKDTQFWKIVNSSELLEKVVSIFESSTWRCFFFFMLLNKILFYLASLQRIFFVFLPPRLKNERKRLWSHHCHKMEWKEKYQDSYQYSEVHGHHLHLNLNHKDS